MADSIDTDAVGTLITTEWGNPPQLQPAGVPNFQGYGGTGIAVQGVEAVYPYLYNSGVDVPPVDETNPLELQEKEWVEQVDYIEANDPDLLNQENVSSTEVVFENPLDTVEAEAAGIPDAIYDVSHDTVDDHGEDLLTEAPVEAGTAPEVVGDPEADSEAPGAAGPPTEAAEETKEGEGA